MPVAPRGANGFAIWRCAHCQREFDPLESEAIRQDCALAKFSGMHRLNVVWIKVPDTPL
jgi:hypothetical protein